jgi:anaerobic magnesium-protoporphyrin IX monomethyl ester cyclase
MQKLDYKRILFVHPLGFGSKSPDHDVARIANIMPPIGLASMASFLERVGVRVDIIDCYARPDSDRLIKEYVRDNKPAFIGITCTTSSFFDGVRIVKMAKEELPEIFAVFGGAHISALKTKILEDHECIDFTVIGEGEQTISELIKSQGRDVEKIEGIIYRAPDGSVIFNGYRKTRLVLDDLPFPAYEKLVGYPEAYKLPIFNYPTSPNSSCISSRGCPYSCSYCDRSVFMKSFRFNSAQYLYEHLKYLKERFGVRHINFYDDQFTFNRKRVEEFTSKVIDNSLGMTFNCAVRAEHIDYELLKQMKAAGCWMVSLGIETGDENLLSQHRQNANLEMLADKIRLIKKAGIRTKGLLMMGLPGESEQSIKKSMDYVFSLPIDDFNLTKFTPFPGSPIYENIHELGEFNEDWSKMDCMNFLFIPKGMQKEQMEILYNKFYQAHFKRPKVLLGYLSMLWKSPDSWKRFISNIGGFARFIKSSKQVEVKQ